MTKATPASRSSHPLLRLFPMRLRYINAPPFVVFHSSSYFEEFIEMAWRFWTSIFVPAVAMIFFVFCEEASGIAVSGIVIKFMNNLFFISDVL
jgi:hypothetical protein